MFLPFITMPYVSRILGPEGIGINSYTYSTVMFFTLFGSLGLSMYGTREIATVQDDIVKRSNIFWNIFIFRFCTVLIAWVIFLFVIPSKNEYYIFYLAQSILFLSTMCDISWYFVGMEQFKTIVARNTVLKVITVILIIIYIKHSDDLLIYIIFVNLGTLVANISMMASLRNNIKKPVWGKIFTTRFFIPFLPAIALFLPNIAANIY
ncbi:oligosaccharide flippase family protein, partial [Leuconostoc mesenteroides]|uniref:oligosaccharide flippase family protein n=1 Tax=Leuconostoc mesenteroides TaxID=1245 RepID=UPI0021DB7F77